MMFGYEWLDVLLVLVFLSSLECVTCTDKKRRRWPYNEKVKKEKIAQLFSFMGKKRILFISSFSPTIISHYRFECAISATPPGWQRAIKKWYCQWYSRSEKKNDFLEKGVIIFNFFWGVSFVLFLRAESIINIYSWERQW